MGNGGYDVLHYEIEIDVDPVADTIQALTTITAQATEELPALDLEMSELCRELGLGDDLVSPASGGAFVWVDGALRPIPPSVLGVPLEPDDLSAGGIVSTPGVAELRARGFADHPGLVGDTTVGEVVRARAGD